MFWSVNVAGKTLRWAERKETMECTSLLTVSLALSLIVLALRPLLGPLRGKTKDVLFLGWFGPVGAAALYYAACSLRETGLEEVWVVGSLVICASLLVHGIIATPEPSSTEGCSKMREAASSVLLGIRRTLQVFAGYSADQDHMHVARPVHSDDERHLDVPGTARPGVETHVCRQSAAGVLPNSFRDGTQYPIGRENGYVRGRQERYASSPSRTVLQNKRSCFCYGPRSGREPDVRAPGYLAEVRRLAPESDLDANALQRLVCAKLVEVLDVPPHQQLRLPLPCQIQDVLPHPFQTLDLFAVPTQRLELLDKPGRRV
jgi:hypothetical protein